MNRRVCFVAPFGLGQKTTIWARTLPLARGLAVRGWSPAILIPPWDTPADAGRRWDDAGVRVINVQLGGGVPGTMRRLMQEIAACEPAIVHVVKPRAHAGLVQWLLWQRRRLGRTSPHILLDTDDWEQAWAPVNGYAWPLARFLAWQEEWGIRHAAGVTAASRWLVDRVRDAAPAMPVRHLPNGIDPPAADALHWTPTGAKDVLFFSRFVEVSPDWLAHFWNALLALQPDARLWVAGAPVRAGLDEDFRRAFDALSASARTRVEWCGYVDRAALAALYAHIGCAIFPAEPTVLQLAKCSVRLATTLLSGVPVVASAVGEQASYGADGAARLVAAEAQPEEFAVAVAEVLSAPAAQAVLSEVAQRRLLERFDWQSLAAKLDAFYAELPERT